MIAVDLVVTYLTETVWERITILLDHYQKLYEESEDYKGDARYNYLEKFSMRGLCDAEEAKTCPCCGEQDYKSNQEGIDLELPLKSVKAKKKKAKYRAKKRAAKKKIAV